MLHIIVVLQLFLKRIVLYFNDLVSFFLFFLYIKVFFKFLWRLKVGFLLNIGLFFLYFLAIFSSLCLLCVHYKNSVS